MTYARVGTLRSAELVLPVPEEADLAAAAVAGVAVVAAVVFAIFWVVAETAGADVEAG